MAPTTRTAYYEIHLQGHLEARWLRWFEGLTISHRQEGRTVITGMMDQSGLHGILHAARDIGMELISVQRIEVLDENQSGDIQTLMNE